ncbi:MAG: serine hydrolase [Treponema sp.]|nr:serine hydrolase [Treponema sp.]
MDINKRTKFESLLICAVCLFLILSCWSDDAIIEYATLEQRLEQVIERFISTNSIRTAISIGVYNNHIQFVKNYGIISLANSDYQKNDEQTLHYVYSITKTIIAATVVSFIEEGKLSYNDTIQHFFPTLCEDYDIDENYINIDATVYELLTHTSGICDYSENHKLYSQNPFVSQSWDPLLLLHYIEHIRQNRGEFIYSSTNFILLGAILEKVSNKQLNELLKERFFLPLNLTASFLMPQEEIDYTRISHPHVYPNTQLNLSSDENIPIDCISVFFPLPLIEILGKSTWAAGGIISNAADMSLWGYALFSSHENATLTKIREHFFDSVANFSNENSEAYGIGCRKIYHPNKKDWFIGSYGRSLGSENLLYYAPQCDTCFVILTSANTAADGNPNIDDLLFTLFEEVAK